MREVIRVPHRDGNDISHVIKAQGFSVYLCGQIGFDYAEQRWGQGIEEQTEMAIVGMQEALECAGATLRDVVQVQVFLSDASFRDAFHGVYHRYFHENPPVRSRYGVTMLAPECLVQMDAIAVTDA